MDDGWAGKRAEKRADEMAALWVGMLAGLRVAMRADEKVGMLVVSWAALRAEWMADRWAVKMGQDSSILRRKTGG